MKIQKSGPPGIGGPRRSYLVLITYLLYRYKKVTATKICRPVLTEIDIKNGPLDGSPQAHAKIIDKYLCPYYRVGMEE